MSDLDDLYQELILDHNKRPRNHGRLEAPSCHAEGFNPLCGDQVTVDVAFGPDDRVADVRFSGKGCAISTASASVMTESVKGRSRAEIERLFSRYQELVTGKSIEDEVDLGKLRAFAGVSEFPARVKCATLSWHTLLAALAGAGSGPISTE